MLRDMKLKKVFSENFSEEGREENGTVSFYGSFLFSHRGSETQRRTPNQLKNLALSFRVGLTLYRLQNCPKKFYPKEMRKILDSSSHELYKVNIRRALFPSRLKLYGEVGYIT